MRHASLRVYLPMDRECFQGYFIAAKDREYAVCQIIHKLLKYAPLMKYTSLIKGLGVEVLTTISIPL